MMKKLTPGWTARPLEELRKHPNGTEFLLRHGSPATQFYVLLNLPGDTSLKGIQYFVGGRRRVIRLETMKPTEFKL